MSNWTEDDVRQRGFVIERDAAGFPVRMTFGRVPPKPALRRQRAAGATNAPAKRKGSKIEESLAGQMQALKLPLFEREHYFAKPRRWRIDFACLVPQVAVEVEGGTWMTTNDPQQKSRHTSGKGMRDDAEKYNELAIRGWLLIRVTADMVRDGSGVRAVERGLRARGVIV